MRCYPVSTRINHVANDDEKWSQPVEIAVAQNHLFPSRFLTCTDANSSTIQFPIPSQRSPAHLLLIEQQIERGHDGFRSPAQLLCKVALADDHISSWELLVDSPSVNRNSFGETPQFLLLLHFGAFSFRLFGLKCPDGCGGDARSRCDQDEPPLRGNG
jgi:hypothetical protein